MSKKKAVKKKPRGRRDPEPGRAIGRALGRALLSVAPPNDEAHFTPASEERLVRQVLAARGWTTEAIERIIDPSWARRIQQVLPKGEVPFGFDAPPDYFNPDGPAPSRVARETANQGALNNRAFSGAEVAQPREVDAVFGALERENERMTEVAGELCDRLGGLLSPEPPAQPAPARPLPSTSTGWGNSIRSQLERLRDTADRIENVTRRLQV